MVTRKVLPYLFTRTVVTSPAGHLHPRSLSAVCHAARSSQGFTHWLVQRTFTKYAKSGLAAHQLELRRELERVLLAFSSSSSVYSTTAAPLLYWQPPCRNYSTKKAKTSKVAKGGKKKIELSSEELEGVLDLPKLQEELKSTVNDFKHKVVEQVSIRTNIGAYDNLPVRTVDGVFPLIQLGQIVQKNPNLILVNMTSSPQYIPAAKQAIAESGLNVNPQQDGTTLFIPIPKVTREHRESLARNTKTLHDKAKDKLKDISNKYVKKIKAAKGDHSEDIVKSAQDLVLDEMHHYVAELDSILDAKQQELLGGKS